MNYYEPRKKSFSVGRVCANSWIQIKIQNYKSMLSMLVILTFDFTRERKILLKNFFVTNPDCVRSFNQMIAILYSNICIVA